MMAALLGKRAAALLEVCLMVFLIAFIAWFFETYLKWFTFWEWCFKTFLILMILFAMFLPRRSFKAYGFIPENPRFTLKWCSIFIAAFILPTVSSITLSMALGAAKPVKLSQLGIILNIIWYMVFVGLVEEAYFRGYIQSRFNEVFEKRWRRFIFKVWKVNYGIGLLLTSLLFALIHIANYWNPLISRWEPVWWMPIHILGCFAFGCVAGALRDASDIYAPASLHGGVMAAYAFLSIYTSELILNVSLFISWFTFFLLLAFFFTESESLKLRAIESK